MSSILNQGTAGSIKEYKGIAFYFDEATKDLSYFAKTSLNMHRIWQEELR